MSEFTCVDCGDLMVHSKCISCGGTRVGTMDGKSEAEIQADEDGYFEMLAAEAENDWREAEDMRIEQRRDDEDYHKELDGYQP